MSDASHVSSRTTSRSYCFTLNNPKIPPKAFHAALEGLRHYKGSVFQLEVGESGTPHYQGYIEFRSPVKWAGLKTLASGIHIEKRKGTSAEASDYCREVGEFKRVDTIALFLDSFPDSFPIPPETAEDFGPFEGGDLGSRPGQRNDLKGIVDCCREHGSLKRVAEEHPQAILRYSRGVAILCRQFRLRRTLPPRVILFYGVTGVGKTRYIHDHEDADELHIKEPGHKWFDGYEQQGAVVMDDFAGAASKMPAVQLLRLLDRYPVTVEVKGEVVPLLATRLYITSNYHPNSWYDWSKREETYRALARRIHQVVCYHDGLPYVADHKAFFEGRDGLGNSFEERWTGAMIDSDPRPMFGPRTDPDRMAPEFVFVPPDHPFFFRTSDDVFNNNQ